MWRIITVLVPLALGFIANAADIETASTGTSCDWSLTASLAAPEANQAAAADEKSVYAITNTLVAKYDRLSWAQQHMTAPCRFEEALQR